MLTYFPKSTVGTAFRVFVGHSAHDNPGLLAALGESKAAFAQEAEDLTASLKQLAIVYPSLTSGFYVNASLSDPGPHLQLGGSIPLGLYAGSHLIPCRSGWNQPTVTDISVHPQCTCRGEYRPTEIYQPLFGSTAGLPWLCPCGCVSCGLGTPISPAAEVLYEVISTFEADISCMRQLLSIVLAAYRLLFSLLHLTLIPRGIAVRQRRFFTNHGTHPPDAAPNDSGLFLEGVFLHPSIA